MFASRAGEAFVEQLKQWDIDHIYGLPGDSINELMDDLRKEQDTIKFIQVRHEEVGALAASAYAKLTGKLGVCLSIAGPGAIHLMNGLYDAKSDGAPVLALVGQISSNQIGTDAFQEVNLERMFDDVAVFNQRIETEEQLPDLLNQAIKTAYDRKGVAVLVIPDDIIARKQKNRLDLTSPVIPKSSLLPDEIDLHEALTLIENAEKPIVLAGKGALQAREELDDFIRNISAPTVISLPGKGVIPDDHPNCLGNLGQIGTKPAYQAMHEADLLLLVGTSFPYREFLPDNIKTIQMDVDTKSIGKRYPVDIGLVGDAKKTLSWLNHNLVWKENRSFLEKYQEAMKDWREELSDIVNQESDRLIAPQVVSDLTKIVDDDAILSVDVGNVTVWMARYFPITNQHFIISSWLATMGCGLPGAIAAKIAKPEKQVIAVCGDGGFSMVMHDFVTAVKYNLPIVVVVLNNSEISMIKYEQQEMGHLEYETDLEGINFAEFAKACGGLGFRVQTRAELESAFQQAINLNKPVIIDAVIENQAPLPGKIAYQQAIKYSEYLVKNFFENGKLDLSPIKKGLKRLK
ncbi:pyruvate oxidase [Aquibacillus saliphilus]|uniref:pyruvate oxidase n=1 Tax=Aquibacillus saliphilus TaxID=1909422 RepID=UPI001CEFCCF8|nr:pyruvate oxidase [Aquibacillus saliphilus]